MLEEDFRERKKNKKEKPTEPGKQKGGYPWQQAKHAKLHSDLPQTFKERIF